MNSIKLIIAISVIAISLSAQIYENVSGSVTFSSKENNKAELFCDNSGNYIYTRENRDGVWWIVVYNEDGLKITEYPDPNQA